MNWSVVKQGMKTTDFRVQVDRVVGTIERQSQYVRHCPPGGQEVQDHMGNDSDVFLVASSWNAVVGVAASQALGVSGVSFDMWYLKAGSRTPARRRERRVVVDAFGMEYEVLALGIL